MDPGVIIALVVAIGSTVAAAVAIVRVAREREREPAAAEPSARILLLVAGTDPAEAALEAALRMARTGGTTLVPAYLARIPETEPLETPPPAAARAALERVERRAAEADVPVETRVQPGRSYRHAVGRLLEAEGFDPIIATASGRNGTGLSPYDIAWLLERTAASVVVFRPG